ncbi:MAG: metallophosphoesterase [Clostridia bacterium]|nr:metallophosphoesterase [Clostridia bacterium]
MNAKKLLALFIALLLALSLFAGCSGNGAKPKVLLTFCAMSDTHIGDTNSNESLKRILGYLNSFEVKPEAYLFAGDITNSTASLQNHSQVRIFKALYEQYGSPEQMFYCLGPSHDVPSGSSAAASRDIYRNTFGEDYFKNDLQSAEATAVGLRHTVFNGFHFFSVDWEGAKGGIDPAALSILDSELKTAVSEHPNKPIFVITHVPDSLNSVLLKYPQVVCFTGHLHNSIAREDSITQKNNYTNVHLGGVNYYRVDGYNRFQDNPFLDLGNIYEFAQGVYVQVDENYKVTVKRVDGYNGTVIGNDWSWTPGKEAVYTSNRKTEAAATSFTSDAALKIEQFGNTDVTVSFDGAKAGGAGPAIYYQVRLLLKKGSSYSTVAHQEIASQQVFYPNDVGIPSLHYSCTFNNVDLSDYAVVVTAFDCWKESSNALVYTNGSYSEKVSASDKIDFILNEREPVKQVISFKYDNSGRATSRYTDGYSMAVRFNPTQSFTELNLLCSSWGDTNGTLDFTLYKWQGDYDTTVAGEKIDSYSLVGYKGSTAYDVLTGTYEAGEYLLVITTPNAAEGVGLYHYPLASGEQKGFICYENGKLMSSYLSFSWTNTDSSETPFIVYP